MTTTVRTFTPRDRLQMLRLLILGNNLEFVADDMQLTVDEVRDVVASHGYPEKARMQRAADMIKARLDGAGMPMVGVSSGIARQPHPDHDIVILVERGKASPKASTRQAAERAEKATSRLLDALRDDLIADEVKRKRDAEEAETRAEVKRLEKALREARAKLGVSSGTSAEGRPYGGSRSGIRKWAREHGFDVGDYGAIKTEITQAWDEAHR